MKQKEFNRMCLDCQHRGGLCSGTHEDSWTGCVWKTAQPEQLEAFIERTEKGGAENDPTL